MANEIEVNKFLSNINDLAYNSCRYQECFLDSSKNETVTEELKKITEEDPIIHLKYSKDNKTTFILSNSNLERIESLSKIQINSLSLEESSSSRDKERTIYFYVKDYFEGKIINAKGNSLRSFIYSENLEVVDEVKIVMLILYRIFKERKQNIDLISRENIMNIIDIVIEYNKTTEIKSYEVFSSLTKKIKQFHDYDNCNDHIDNDVFYLDFLFDRDGSRWIYNNYFNQRMIEQVQSITHDNPFIALQDLLEKLDKKYKWARDKDLPTTPILKDHNNSPCTDKDNISPNHLKRCNAMFIKKN